MPGLPLAGIPPVRLGWYQTGRKLQVAVIWRVETSLSNPAACSIARRKYRSTKAAVFDPHLALQGTLQDPAKDVIHHRVVPGSCIGQSLGRLKGRKQ